MNNSNHTSVWSAFVRLVKILNKYWIFALATLDLPRTSFQTMYSNNYDDVGDINSICRMCMYNMIRHNFVSTRYVRLNRAFCARIRIDLARVIFSTIFENLHRDKFVSRSGAKSLNDRDICWLTAKRFASCSYLALIICLANEWTRMPQRCEIHMCRE